LTDLRDPDQSLTLPADEMRRFGYRVVDMIVEHVTRLGDAPVGRALDRATLEGRLREPAPEAGRDPDAVLDRLAADVLDAIVHVDHPRFFAYVPGPGNFVGAMADALAAGFNVFAGSWPMSSGPAMAELVVLDWLRTLCRMPETTSGLFVSGGSMANLTALAVARASRLGERFSDAIVYTSDQTHSSIERGARTLGFRLDQLRRVPTDERFRMRPDLLGAMIAEDRRAGRLPFCVVGSAGTTNTGVADPLAELAAICRAEDLWLHVDGAYGAAAMLTERGAAALAGIELADSLALDPHKWLQQPFECGCVLVRDGSLLEQTFRTVPAYLKDSDAASDEVNFRDRGVQLTRGFRALKLWMSIQIYGLASFRAAVERGIALAERAEERLRRHAAWRIVTPATLGIVTFRCVDERLLPAELDLLQTRVIAALAASGFALLSSTHLNGATVLRLCTINARTTEADVDATVDLLVELAARELATLR
jgi:glutamate/tyrosine decarboxylase-like PLP-dependent enzyme